MDERLEQEQAQQEQQARSAFMADKGLMGQGWTEGQPLESLQQQQGAYESALARNQAIAAQNMGLADRALANAKTQQEQTLARVTPIRAEYLKRVTPLQEQAAKNTAIVDMLNQGGGVAGYGATKIWLQSLDGSMVTNVEIRDSMAGTGIQERVGQILAQAEGKGFLTDPQAAELAALVEQANFRIRTQYNALNEQASAAAQAYGVDPGLVTVFGELPGMPGYNAPDNGSSGETKPNPAGPRPKVDSFGNPTN